MKIQSIKQCPYYSDKYHHSDLEIHECTLDINQIRPYPEIQKYENYNALICCIDWYRQKQYNDIDNRNTNNCYFLRSLNYLLKQIERINNKKRLSDRELLLYAKYHNFIKNLPLPNIMYFKPFPAEFYDKFLEFIIDGQNKSFIKNRIAKGLILECKTNDFCPYKPMIIEREMI